MKKSWSLYVIQIFARKSLASDYEPSQLQLVTFVDIIVDFSELVCGIQIAKVLLQHTLEVSLDLVLIQVVLEMEPFLPLVSLLLIISLTELVKHLFLKWLPIFFQNRDQRLVLVCCWHTLIVFRNVVIFCYKFYFRLVVSDFFVLRENSFQLLNQRTGFHQIRSSHKEAILTRGQIPREVFAMELDVPDTAIACAFEHRVFALFVLDYLLSQLKDLDPTSYTPRIWVALEQALLQLDCKHRVTSVTQVLSSSHGLFSQLVMKTLWDDSAFLTVLAPHFFISKDVLEGAIPEHGLLRFKIVILFVLEQLKLESVNHLCAQVSVVQQLINAQTKVVLHHDIVPLDATLSVFELIQRRQIVVDLLVTFFTFFAFFLAKVCFIQPQVLHNFTALWCEELASLRAFSQTEGATLKILLELFEYLFSLIFTNSFLFVLLFEVLIILRLRLIAQFLRFFGADIASHADSFDLSDAGQDNLQLEFELSSLPILYSFLYCTLSL